VVTFKNVGVGATTGRTPITVEAMAHGAITFVQALDFQSVDLLGFSIGSFVAQEIALIRPELPRRVVLASSAPRGAADVHGWAPEVIGAVGTPKTSPGGYLDVFFAPTETSREAGNHAAGRIFGGRTTDRGEPTTWQTRQASTTPSAAGAYPTTRCSSQPQSAFPVVRRPSHPGSAHAVGRHGHASRQTRAFTGATWGRQDQPSCVTTRNLRGGPHELIA
jgi:pimeloyl-ACP methyl ester carboxylesterase